MTRIVYRLLLAAACLGLTAAQPAPDSITGLWALRQSVPPAVQGTLLVSRQGALWHAAISGDTADFRSARGEIRFVLSGGKGQFRGRMEGRNISGFWIQPPGDAGGPGQAFASPLVLTRTATNRWRGDVHPLPNVLNFYVKIFADDKGLVGVFRNPEANANGNAGQFRVSRDGDKIHFAVKPDGEEIAYDATWLHNPDRLSLTWPNFGQTVVLTRSEAAPNFFPRPPGAGPYIYAQPPITNDGWKTARAKDAGIDETALTKLVQDIIDSDPAARRPELIHSLLIAHRGKLVLEEYFYGFDRGTPHDLRSAGKTFSSVMMGAAIRSGVAIGPDSRIYQIMANEGPFANPDPRKAEIALAQLMTHSAGLACDDNDSGSPGEEGKMQSQTAQPDWWKYTLDLLMAHDPGSRYAYCSANINLVGGALTRTTGVWLPDYFERTVARPLQFRAYYWNLMANGEGYLGGGAYLRPRDLLKVGQAYLDGGVWNGHRIVTADWIKGSTASRIAITPATTGKTADEFAQGYIEGADALAWHLAELKTATRTYHAYGASGNGGQLLVVVPELDLAVVFTGGNYGQGGIWNKWRDKMIPEEIIPAILQ